MRPAAVRLAQQVFGIGKGVFFSKVPLDISTLGAGFLEQIEESGPEWRNSKKPLIEDYTFAYPRSVSKSLGFADPETSTNNFGLTMMLSLPLPAVAQSKTKGPKGSKKGPQEPRKRGFKIGSTIVFASHSASAS